jgi:putative SOS response-associated peptidase YedK
LWETWCGADGSEIDTACLLTTPAGPTLVPISRRMPVVIVPSDFDLWLGPDESVGALLGPCAADLLSAEPVRS